MDLTDLVHSLFGESAFFPLGDRLDRSGVFSSRYGPGERVSRLRQDDGMPGAGAKIQNNYRFFSEPNGATQ